MKRTNQIHHVEPQSPAERIGLRAGDRLQSIDGHAIHDTLDLMFHAPASTSWVEWDDETATHHRKQLKAFPGEHHGITLEEIAIGQCRNQCLFCFVHQLPKGLRKPLYIKDEDYRLSFLYGNYITGTNLTDDDISRIIEQRLSPMYISVHATDTATRSRLLGTPEEHCDVLSLIAKLAAANIKIQAQIVLCPGINDGAMLTQTLHDLAQFASAIDTVAIVPLGLTCHRSKLPQLQPITKEYVLRELPAMQKVAKEIKKKLLRDFALFSDEFYLIADLKPPMYSGQREFPQLDNGVGMVARFYKDASYWLNSLKNYELKEPARIALLTSVLGAKVLENFIAKANAANSNYHFTAIPITNTLLGETVTVSGLLCGNDFKNAIVANPGYNAYLIPSNALRNDDEIFLDDMTFDQLIEQVRDDAPQSADRLFITDNTASGIVNIALEFVHA